MSESRATTLEARHGLVLRIVDATTRVPAASGAEATARDGDYVEMLRRCDELICSGAVERVGTYQVVVKKPGYTLWERDGVVVTRNGPHVAATVIDVELAPQDDVVRAV